MLILMQVTEHGGDTSWKLLISAPMLMLHTPFILILMHILVPAKRITAGARS